MPLPRSDTIRAMNPSTALATVLVDELVRQGVRHAVLCPGSRSAPLAYALQHAARQGRLELHVRVDERSAGFLALGLGKLSRCPAAVVTTSGTAVANLHPAVLEASHGLVPLIALTADRPAELRGTGANQTTVQPGIFGAALRWSGDLAAPERRPGQNAVWRSTVGRVVAAARGDAGEAGPVHLNVGLREPLVPDCPGGEPWPEDLDGRAGGRPWVVCDAPDPLSARGWPGPSASDAPGAHSPYGGAGAAGEAATLAAVPRTLVLVGDLPDPVLADRAVEWARASGAPVVAEPFGSHPRDAVIPHGPALLGAEGWLADHLPERVVVVGRPTLARPVSALLRRPGIRVEAVTATSGWSDPSHVVSTVHALTVLQNPVPGIDREWAAAWTDAGMVVAKAVAAEPLPWPSGLAVASTVLESLPAAATLFVGSSNAVRDLDLAGARGGGLVTVVGNRGLAGIDGCVSTAAGIALADDRPAYALVGDLTLLHDAGGLLAGPLEREPDLTLVVVNDDGGGIFTLLEPGDPARSDDFERVFGTPTGTDLASLCAAHGVRHVRAATPEELAAEVSAEPRGRTVVEVRVERGSHRAAHARFRALVAAALEGLA